MPDLTPLLSLIEKEFIYEFIRASGPGGQNVNKVATAVQLRFDAKNSPFLPEDVKKRLIKLTGYRMTQAGVLVIEAKRYRTQDQNRSDARQRLLVLLQKAMIIPKRRHPTHPTPTSQVRRLEAKLQRGKTKRLRRSVKHED
jgi:ribosome-associated protein